MRCHRCGNETGQKTFFMTNEPSCERCADIEMQELLKSRQKAQDMTDPLKSAQDEIKQLNEHLHTANSELKRMSYQVNALKIIIDFLNTNPPILVKYDKDFMATDYDNFKKVGKRLMKERILSMLELYKIQCVKIINRYTVYQEVLSDKDVETARAENDLIDILMSEITGMED